MGNARHPGFVRVTHWLTTLAFLALLTSGVEILISHPRFYWGETGNVNMAPLFSIPIPASRHTVPTGYDYVLPDQNGWSRSLHFEAAWLSVLSGLLYVALGFLRGHFGSKLLPSGTDLTPKKLREAVRQHLRFGRGAGEVGSYNVLQRVAYLLVIFVFFPFLIWTGLAQSPAFASAFPGALAILGGRQTARTLHFFVSILLVLFFLIHVLMVSLSGFRERMVAMITGRLPQAGERS